MSSINKYELLKNDGTWTDRVKYVSSLPDKSEIEKYLKESSSHDDLQMLLFLSKFMKNEKNLLEIFQNDSFPVKQRAIAAKTWFQLQTDENQLHQFIVETLNNKNIPRFLKHEIFRNIHQTTCSKNPSFFYDLLCHLTKTFAHNQFNLSSYLLPFCTRDQILDLLSRWSIKGLEQIDPSSFLTTKLICYQPLIIIHLIKEDLNEKISNKTKLSEYLRKNQSLFNLLTEKETKAMCHLALEHVKRLPKHERVLPYFCASKQTICFKRAPDEMIELITLAASHTPGVIRYGSNTFNDCSSIDSFSFPRSFSVNHYVDLFFALYDTCKWSSHHLNNLIGCMFPNINSHTTLTDIRKRRKWFYDIVISERIGKEVFIKKLLEKVDQCNLDVLNEYRDITTPLSVYLIFQRERKGINQTHPSSSKLQHLLMTQEVFDRFLSVFKQTSSDVNSRQEYYKLFLEGAISTSEEMTKNVLQWIKQRFTNERIEIIESFLSNLSTYNDRFQLEILPNNFELIEAIIEIAINHFELSVSTLEEISSYGLFLLKRVEYHADKEQKEKIQTFACKIIKRSISMSEKFPSFNLSLSGTYPQARTLLTNYFISDEFPRLLSKLMLVELEKQIDLCVYRKWHSPQMDSFINSFFTNYLPSSSELLSAFQIDKYSSLISLFLRNCSTKYERVNYLINSLDKVFFLNADVQRIALYSQQHRQLINQLIEDDTSLTVNKLSNKDSKLTIPLQLRRKIIRLPGLHIEVLNSSYRQLTGKQQEHITKIILYDYLQATDVKNYSKVKSFHLLRRLPHTYNETFQWIDKQKLSVSSDTASITNRQSCDELVVCLPAFFDISREKLLEHYHFLITNLNASNAKYISGAILSISRKIPDELFLKLYFELVRDENFQKLGITVNKEILRLSIHYISEPNLIPSIIKPLWDSQLHQDIRACLIATLLHFIDGSNEDPIIWQILEQAAHDDYLPVIETLFPNGSNRTVNQLHTQLDIFVNRIQFKVLDNPTSLEARLLAWSNIDYEHCDVIKLIEKAKVLCIQFDKDSDRLWEHAFDKIILILEKEQALSFDVVIEIIKRLISCREEIDSKLNAIDNRHDLPVYRRLHYILTKLGSHINEFDNEKKLLFRSFIPTIFQSEKAFSSLIGTLLFKLAQSKEDVEEVLMFFQNNLSEIDFNDVMMELKNIFSNWDSCPFISQLQINEKVDMIQWFIEIKNRPLFVLEFFKKELSVVNDVDRERLQNLLRQMRQSERLHLRKLTLEFIVPWGEVTNDSNVDDQMSVSDRSGDVDTL